MLVVVVEVPVIGVTGVRGVNLGERGLDFADGFDDFSSEGEGISSRILRRHSIVRYACLSCGDSVEESDCEGSSSIGGGITRATIVGDGSLLDDRDRLRDSCN